MTLSVIVCVYEQPRTLELLLACLRCQSYDGPVEIVVCDDGSGGSSALLDIVRRASSYGELDVKYIWQPHRGFRAGQARNNGIRSAKGDLLVFLDGDMVVGHDFLESHVSHHNLSPTIVCGTRVWAGFNDDGIEDGALFVSGGEIDDLRCLLSDWMEGLRSISCDVESAEQRRWLSTPYPWMSMLGCNFSVPRRSEVMFDEAFVGWGSEDRELAFRLHGGHGYSILCPADVQAVHLTPVGSGSAFNPLLRSDGEGLAEFIRNKLYFRLLYPDADVRPSTALLLNCRLDERTDAWRTCGPRSVAELEALVEQAEKWMDRHEIPFRPRP